MSESLDRALDEVGDMMAEPDKAIHFYQMVEAYSRQLENGIAWNQISEQEAFQALADFCTHEAEMGDDLEYENPTLFDDASDGTYGTEQ